MAYDFRQKSRQQEKMSDSLIYIHDVFMKNIKIDALQFTGVIRIKTIKEHTRKMHWLVMTS